ncbi:MAG TPA: PocR ligand-binding domain-containing protein [Desulfitobacteriaceae bacterium]|nr:PocR ligand-binding domain-containing protein [Desulfitobacteriaceae bacterium]
MKYKFSEIVDISKLQIIMEGFYATSHIPSSVFDTEGNILIAVGWKEICTKFHRVNKETKILCRQSDLYINNYLRDKIINQETKVCYTCANGLIDMAAPIIIEGEHLATVFTGQFFWEEPDVDQFRKQAGRYGFNEKDYLEALKKVPIATKEKMDSFMDYVSQIAEMLAQMGLARLRLIASQEKALQESEERLKTIIDNTLTEKKQLEKDMYRSEEALKESEHLLRKLHKVAHIGSYVIDLKTKTWRGSPELNELFGIDETFPHTIESRERIIHPDWRNRLFDYHARVIREKILFDYEYKIIRINDGEERWIHEIGDIEYDNQHKAVRVIGMVQDITDRKKVEEEVVYLSYHDKLTGLYNRRFYEEEIKRLDTERNLPISIIMGDVNGLKLTNDAFGHDKGDELLKKAAKAIQSACRADDIVARWGGDEFVILLPKTNINDAEKIVNRIKESYSNQYVNALSVSISFGWDTKENKDENILTVLKSAEDHMYKHKIIENESMRGNIIGTIIKTLHEKNPREEQHSERVSEICQSIGRVMGFSEIEVNKLKVVGLLHDIGKIAIEEGILNKPGKLTRKEWNEIKRHPEIGYRILTTSHDMLELADCILAHHERWDGKGYPKGLKGEAIPRVARIIALADSYDAMTSERAYKRALSEEEALAEICKNSGIQFDPEIVKIFLERVLEREILHFTY